MNKKIKKPLTNLDGSIEIIGSNRVIVEDIMSIVEYSEEHIIIDIGSRMLNIFGQSLEIYDYFNKSLIIDGKVNSVTFE